MFQNLTLQISNHKQHWKCKKSFIYITRVAITTVMVYYFDLIWSKIDVPNLVNYHNQMIIFVWDVVMYGSKYGHQKDMCIKRNWTTCSKHEYHFRRSSHYNWEGLIWPVHKIVHLTMNDIFIWAPKIMKKAPN